MSAVHHRWDLTPRGAIALQNALRGQVVTEDRFGPVAHVAGVDVGFEDDGKTARAAVAVLVKVRPDSLADLKIGASPSHTAPQMCMRRSGYLPTTVGII